MMGEAAEKLEGEYSEEIRVIEANLDDLNPRCTAILSNAPWPPVHWMCSPPPCK